MTEEIIALTHSKKSVGGKRSTVTRYANLIKNLGSQANPSVLEIEEALSKVKKYYAAYEKAWDEIGNHDKFVDEYISCCLNL